MFYYFIIYKFFLKLNYICSKLFLKLRILKYKNDINFTY